MQNLNKSFKLLNKLFQNKPIFNFAKTFNLKPPVCYYKILNVSSDASSKEIKGQYLQLAKKYHPDVNEGRAAEAEKFKEISEAYQVLSNPENRKLYDEQNGMNSFWEKDGFKSEFQGGSQESYEEFIHRKREYKDTEFSDKDFKNLEEEVDNYFKTKYFKNEEVNRKYPDGYENPFEMTAKLYRTHQQNVEQKKGEYTEHFANTHKAYYEKTEENTRLRKQGPFLYLLKEFRIPIFLVFAYLTISGIYQGVKESNKNKQEVVDKIELVTEGRGYRTKALPLNAV